MLRDSHGPELLYTPVRPGQGLKADVQIHGHAPHGLRRRYGWLTTLRAGISLKNTPEHKPEAAIEGPHAIAGIWRQRGM